MQEGMFYGVYFVIILFTYVVKLRLEKEGYKAARSYVREGVISGVTIYLLYQTLMLHGISTRMKVVDGVLGISALVAGAVFFLRRKS